MHRIISLLLFAAFVNQTSAQTASVSDPIAVSLAQQSIAALAGGTTITDVTLTANVISIHGSDNRSGTGTLLAKGVTESRVDLSLSGSERIDVRNLTNGLPTGSWAQDGQTSQSYALHNCLTDAVWFFPALSSLERTNNSTFVFKYVGEEQHGGVNTQHIRVFQLGTQTSLPSFQQLSTIDFYLDPNSSLPLAISFETHPDNDMNSHILAGANFASYQVVNGIPVPLHIQQILNGSVVLDIEVTNVQFNTGLADDLFTLP